MRPHTQLIIPLIAQSREEMIPSMLKLQNKQKIETKNENEKLDTYNLAVYNLVQSIGFTC